MRRKRKKTYSVWLKIVILTVGILGIIAFYISRVELPVNKMDKSIIEVEIEAGTSKKQIAKALKGKRLIRNKKYFLHYIKVNNKENLKSGVYELSKSYSLSEIVDKLNSGARPVGEKITIKEGQNIYQIAQILEENGITNKQEFLDLTKDKSEFEEDFEFLKNDSIQTLEGFLYPETYFIKKDTPSEEVINKILQGTRQFFEKNDILEVNDRIKGYIKNTNQLLILASIVEKESANQEDKHIIAGVFINRLKYNMPLQSCVTVEYVTGEHKDRLNSEDIKVDSPYNPYKNQGLPPTPICTPTVDTIEAVKNYKDTDYFYFVATKDGKHIFSKTYEEHLQATKDIYGEI